MGALTDPRFLPPDPFEGCARIVEAACGGAKAAAASIPDPPATSSPNWDTIANALASVSVGLAWGSIFLALLAIFVGMEWGRKVVDRAEKEARKRAEEAMEKWLADEAPMIVSRHVEYILNASLGSSDDEKAAEELGSAEL